MALMNCGRKSFFVLEGAYLDICTGTPLEFPNQFYENPLEIQVDLTRFRLNALCLTLYGWASNPAWSINALKQILDAKINLTLLSTADKALANASTVQNYLKELVGYPNFHGHILDEPTNIDNLINHPFDPKYTLADISPFHAGWIEEVCRLKNSTRFKKVYIEPYTSDISSYLTRLLDGCFCYIFNGTNSEPPVSNYREVNETQRKQVTSRRLDYWAYNLQTLKTLG